MKKSIIQGLRSIEKCPFCRSNTWESECCDRFAGCLAKTSEDIISNFRDYLVIITKSIQLISEGWTVDQAFQKSKESYLATTEISIKDSDFNIIKKALHEKINTEKEKNDKI